MNKLIEKSTELTQRGAVAMQLNHSKFRRQRGATAIEYAVIAALVAVALFVIFGGGEGGFQSIFTDTFKKVKDALE